MDPNPNRNVFKINAKDFKERFPDLEACRQFAKENGKQFPPYKGMTQNFFALWFTGKKKLLDIGEGGGLEFDPVLAEKIFKKEDLISIVRDSEKMNAYFPDKIGLDSYPRSFFFDVIFKEDPHLYFQLYSRYKAESADDVNKKWVGKYITTDQKLAEAFKNFKRIQRNVRNPRSFRLSINGKSTEIFQEYEDDELDNAISGGSNQMIKVESILASRKNANYGNGKVNPVHAQPSMAFSQPIPNQNPQPQIAQANNQPSLMESLLNMEINTEVIAKLISTNQFSSEILITLIRNGKIPERLFNLMIDNHLISGEMFIDLLKANLANMDNINKLASDGKISQETYAQITNAVAQQNQQQNQAGNLNVSSQRNDDNLEMSG